MVKNKFLSSKYFKWLGVIIVFFMAIFSFSNIGKSSYATTSTNTTLTAVADPSPAPSEPPKAWQLSWNLYAHDLVDSNNDLIDPATASPLYAGSWGLKKESANAVRLNHAVYGKMSDTLSSAIDGLPTDSSTFNSTFGTSWDGSKTYFIQVMNLTGYSTNASFQKFEQLFYLPKSSGDFPSWVEYSLNSETFDGEYDGSVVNVQFNFDNSDQQGFFYINYTSGQPHKTRIDNNHVFKIGHGMEKGLSIFNSSNTVYLNGATDAGILQGVEFKYISRCFQYSFTSDLLYPDVVEMHFYNFKILGANSFINQTALKIVTFDNTLLQVGAKLDNTGAKTFQGCNNLNYVYFDSTAPPYFCAADGSASTWDTRMGGNFTNGYIFVKNNTAVTNFKADSQIESNYKERIFAIPSSISILAPSPQVLNFSDTVNKESSWTSGTYNATVYPASSPQKVFWSITEFKKDNEPLETIPSWFVYDPTVFANTFSYSINLSSFATSDKGVYTFKVRASSIDNPNVCSAEIEGNNFTISDYGVSTTGSTLYSDGDYVSETVLPGTQGYFAPSEPQNPFAIYYNNNKIDNEGYKNFDISASIDPDIFSLEFGEDCWPKVKYTAPENTTGDYTCSLIYTPKTTGDYHYFLPITINFILHVGNAYMSTNYYTYNISLGASSESTSEETSKIVVSCASGFTIDSSDASLETGTDNHFSLSSSTETSLPEYTISYNNLPKGSYDVTVKAEVTIKNTSSSEEIEVDLSTTIHFNVFNVETLLPENFESPYGQRCSIVTTLENSPSMPTSEKRYLFAFPENSPSNTNPYFVELDDLLGTLQWSETELENFYICTKTRLSLQNWNDGSMSNTLETEPSNYCKVHNYFFSISSSAKTFEFDENQSGKTSPFHIYKNGKITDEVSHTYSFDANFDHPDFMIIDTETGEISWTSYYHPGSYVIAVDCSVIDSYGNSFVIKSDYFVIKILPLDFNTITYCALSIGGVSALLVLYILLLVHISIVHKNYHMIRKVRK